MLYDDVWPNNKTIKCINYYDKPNNNEMFRVTKMSQQRCEQTHVCVDTRARSTCDRFLQVTHHLLLHYYLAFTSHICHLQRFSK